MFPTMYQILSLIECWAADLVMRRGLLEAVSLQRLHNQAKKTGVSGDDGDDDDWVFLCCQI